jgi:hypothetical protein
MYESKAIVSVELFNGTKEDGSLRIDKNGKQAVMLRIIAGKSPNRNVLAGTVAENSGFIPGKMYFVQIREREANENGRQFTFTKLSDVSPLEALQAEAMLGKPEVFNVNEAVKEEVTTKNVTDKAEKL